MRSTARTTTTDPPPIAAPRPPPPVETRFGSTLISRLKLMTTPEEEEQCTQPSVVG